MLKFFLHLVVVNAFYIHAFPKSVEHVEKDQKG